MARNSGRSEGARAVRADADLRRRYKDLHAAMSKWLDDGGFEPVDVALDAIALDDIYHPHSDVTSDMLRDERVRILSQQLTAAGQMVTRLRRELSAAVGLRRELKDRLLVTIAEPRKVPDYVVKLWDRLKAAGAEQTDLQPQSHALAKAILEAARVHNAKRLAQGGGERDDDALESLPQEPVTTWRKLPRTFAGFQFVDVEPDDVLDPEPCELPPSPDIAYYTLDKSHRDFGADRRETYKDWSAIVMDWADRNGRSLSRQHARIWAMLLAHRMPTDRSAVQDLLSEVLRSPWKKGGIVKIRRHVELEDDVPFC